MLSWTLKIKSMECFTFPHFGDQSGHEKRIPLKTIHSEQGLPSSVVNCLQNEKLFVNLNFI